MKPTIQSIREKLELNRWDLSTLTAEERAILTA